ncbi:MAG: S1C family serine protease [Thermoproteota archaeon]|nr:S1C family serine protease [Thermoproteota archaeon]
MVRLGYARRTVMDRKTLAALELLAVFFVLILISVVIGILNSTRAEAQITQGNNNNSNTNTASFFSLPELFSNVEGSVVQVTASNELGISGIGSGFVYDNNSHIITSSSLVDQSNATLRVTFLDGTTYHAKLVGSDPLTDLAILNVPEVPEEKLKPLALGNSTELKIGEQIATIGSPYGIAGALTLGVVAKVGFLFSMEGTPYSIPDTIVADLPVYLGNSGGPLFNMKGQVVGMTSASFTQTSISFSVSSNTIKKVVPSLISSGSFAHPSLGLSGTDITPELAEAIGLREEQHGFLVIDVDPGGPAAKAGIFGSSLDQSATVNVDGREIALGGDVIVAADGMPVRKIDDLISYIFAEKSVGDNLKLTIFRNGQFQDINIIVEAKSP